MITPQAENKNYEISSGKTKNRESMGYNSLARLAGNKVEAFTCIAKELSIRGFSAPKIFESDLSKGPFTQVRFKDFRCRKTSYT